MAKTGRKSPSPGRGENLAGSDAILRALAMETLDQEAMAELREHRKRHRKGYERDGVDLGQLDRLYKLKDEPIGEIERMLRSTIHYLGALFEQIPAQFDFFKPKPEAPERQFASRHAGKMAALQGKDATPPPGLAGDDLEQWLAGHAEAAPYRQKAKRDRAKDLAAALRIAEGGGVVDGTGDEVKEAAKSGQAQQVLEQSRKDFAEDNPGAPAAGAEFSEATADELSTQAGRDAIEQRRQAAETPDPDDVKKQAEALKKNGFGQKPLPGEKVQA